MTILIRTDDPAQLLSDIRKKISQKHIETWFFDNAGDFSHTPEQWRYKAWLRPHVEPGQLRFSLISNNKINLTKAIYGVYHGRFSEMLLTHFEDRFHELRSTARQVEYAGA
ncbi:hypothetical protein WL78_00500 [Burkholderia ubonensis]|uniref:hypothetical protein n=1 Tax=Burkholderia TaxID=32008 RepID=UPI0007529BA1|nr:MULTISPECIES: hypothetical protein [Burkholderia]KWE77275.1 hypothetical protein WL78_00500 [Burkholderia ubonensis]MBN3732649.1 hypothetical protein [Burkholderia sp. Tr-20390]